MVQLSDQEINTDTIPRTELQASFELHLISTNVLLSFWVLTQDPTLYLIVMSPYFLLIYDSPFICLIFHDLETFGVPVSYFVEWLLIWVGLTFSHDYIEVTHFWLNITYEGYLKLVCLIIGDSRSFGEGGNGQVSPRKVMIFSFIVTVYLGEDTLDYANILFPLKLLPADFGIHQWILPTTAITGKR